MDLNIVVLAAGRGKRMKSKKPKVLHEALGRPMVLHVVDAVKKLKPSRIIAVIGNGAEQVRECVGEDQARFVLQKELLGTGDALSICKKELKSGSVLVLNGDCPLITTNTLKRLLNRHRRNKNLLSFLSFIDESMKGYGRIIRDSKGEVKRIVEDKHATPDEREKCNELNGGVYVMETSVLRYLDKIKRNSSSGEYYLTDIVSIVSEAGMKLDAYQCASEEIRGVNNRAELFEVSDILRRRKINELMEKGVTFVNPDMTVIESQVTVKNDSLIYPNTYIEGNSSIGKGCTIYPGSRIRNSVLGNNVVIKDNTLIEDSKVYDKASVGPCAHLRPGSLIGAEAKVGNFVEVKKTKLGKGSKASHLTYLGDADIGPGVNIGAGTITCNYDGKNKSKTVIKPGVFIGSDTQLVAPVVVGKDAYIGAGSTVTKDVPSGALALSRSPQRNLGGWSKKKKGAKSKKS